MSDAAMPSAPIPPEHLLAHAGWVRRLAGRLLADPDAADDLAQETLARAMASAPIDPARPRGWLATIARRLAWSGREQTRARCERERRAAASEALPSAAELVARASVQRAVVDAVLALSEPYCSTLLLRFFEEVETSEIARRRGEPVETVRTRLKRGLAQLRERLGRELDVETTGGARRRGLEALVLLVQPVGGGGTAAAVGASATAAGMAAATGAMAMATTTKLIAATVIVAAGAWVGLELTGKGLEPPQDDATLVGERPVAPPTESRDDSLRAQRAAEVPDRDRTEMAADVDPLATQEPAAREWSPRIAKLRAELTKENLGRDNVEDDLGSEIRAAIHGLRTETLDLEGLLAYLESREESSWVVRDSLESEMASDRQAVRWTQAYENSGGGGSAALVSVSARSSIGQVALMLLLRSWGGELDPDLAGVEPMLIVSLSSGANGRLEGRLHLDLREEMVKAFAKGMPGASTQSDERADLIKRHVAPVLERFEALRARDGLPRTARLKIAAGQGDLTYVTYGSRTKEELEANRRTSRPLTDREIAALQRLYDRYQELAKQHVAEASAKPASGK